MPEETRTILLLTYCDRRTCAEASRHAGVSVRSLARKILEATQKLTAIINRLDLL